MKNKLKIGVLGVGHFGQLHLKCLKMLPDYYDLIGFFDPDDAQAQIAVTRYNIPRFQQIEQLLEQAEVIDIVTPTPTHFELAQLALAYQNHIFIEKPMTQTLEEANMLVQLAQQQTVKIQVGHIERFNPAFTALRTQTFEPIHFDFQRLGTYHTRGKHTSVVLDLMIHDLDLLLSLVPDEVKTLTANGLRLLSPTTDVAHASITFYNGCTANLTASRIALTKKRQLHMTHQTGFAMLDFVRPTATFVTNDNATASLNTVELPIQPVNAIKEELKALAISILEDAPVKVSIQQGKKAVALAHDVEKLLG